jgi:hypothetical protein
MKLKLPKIYPSFVMFYSFGVSLCDSVTAVYGFSDQICLVFQCLLCLATFIDSSSTWWVHQVQTIFVEGFRQI